MGTGRRATATEQSSSQGMSAVPHRGLPQEELGGVIFGATASTMDECLTKHLFGLPQSHFIYVQNITNGLPLFLFNYSNRHLYGLFEANGDGDININPNAWNSTIGRGKFPAQVRVKVTQMCSPLPEAMFKPLIKENYFKHGHFLFELDKKQVSRLIDAMVRQEKRESTTFHSTLPGKVLLPAGTHWTVPPPQQIPEGPWTVPPPSKVPHVQPISQKNSTTTSTTSSNSKWSRKHPERKRFSSPFGELKMSGEVLELDKVFSNGIGGLNQDNGVEFQEVAEKGRGTWKNLETEYYFGSGVKIGGKMESLENLDDEKIERERAGNGIGGGTGGNSGEIVDRTKENGEEFKRRGEKSYIESLALEKEENDDWEKKELEKVQAKEVEFTLLNLRVCEKLKPISRECSAALRENVELYSSEIIQMHKERIEQEKLLKMIQKTFGDFSRLNQLEEENELLKKNQKETERELKNLRKSFLALKLKVDSFAANSNAENSPERETSSPEETQEEENEAVIPREQEPLSDGEETDYYEEAEEDEFGGKNVPDVYLFGGHNGKDLTSEADVFLSNGGKWQKISPISTKKAYFSSSTLNNSIYVIGGGDGKIWENTVEKYDKDTASWHVCEPMGFQRGGLSAVSCQGFLYSLGGAQDSDSLSEVEVYDPFVDKWKSSVPLTEKRYSLAAFEKSNSIFAVGGFDGSSYLKTAERFDPREGKWCQVASCEWKRGSSFFATVGDNFYFMGGYDGANFLDIVEAYDTRADKWRRLSDMTSKRAHGAAVGLEDGLYVIGGMDENSEYLEKMEFYSEDHGWTLVDNTYGSTQVQRCFFSASAL